MPGFLYVRSRDMQGPPAALRSQLEAVARRLAPDNIEYQPPVAAERQDELLVLLNGGAAVRHERTSVCLGSICDRTVPWWKVGSGCPDGSFGLLRSDEQATELLSDAVGTHTLWYALTDGEFVASTSQRAIVMWLKSYDRNEDVFSWQLSSGTLGPGLSWDRRIRALPPATTLTFDRRLWSAALQTTPVQFCAARDAPERQCDELMDAIAETFRHLDLDIEHSALALSGGYDSRMILLMLKDRPYLHTVTWGRRAAPHERGNDANIAERLAGKMHTLHSYFELEMPANGVEEVLDRFVRLGEGRTESVSGYVDGFGVWKALHERGCVGVFRGDEAFGCKSAPTAADVYRNMKCNVLADFEPQTAAPLAELLPEQRRPQYLERRPDESLQAWRDRLNAEFELPYVIAPLNDLKFGYVDVVHPLVSRRIVEQVRRMSDELRTDKRAFKSVVESMLADVPYAKRTAIVSPDQVLREPRTLEALREQLRRQSEGSDTVAAISCRALELLGASSPRRGVLAACVSRIAARAGHRASDAQRLSPVKVAFRTYIIGKMQALLREDARALH